MSDPSQLFNKEDTTSSYDQQFAVIHPGAIPKTPILWPIQRSAATKNQQNKGSSRPTSLGSIATTGPSQSPVNARTTPQSVSKVRVVLRPAVGGLKPVTVQFTHPPQDQFFSSANVYLKKAGGQATLVAAGAKSPLTFHAPINSAPHSIYVTSVGAWGETPVLVSPSHPVRLSS